MSISIITPTSENESRLRLLYKVIQKQLGPWEWLICDSSHHPSVYFSKLKDRHVTYIHDPQKLSRGVQRNLLIEQAKGEYIAHFEVGNYYAAHYLQKLRKELANADFFKFSAFFCYCRKDKDFFYLDAKNPDHTSYITSAITKQKIRVIDFSQKPSSSLVKQTLLEHGFCYAYRKDVSRNICFEDSSNHENHHFIRKILKYKYKATFTPDEEGHVLYIMENVNTAKYLPQYRLPSFLSQNFFPNMNSFFKKYPKYENSALQ